jgi:hypothetical protein
MIRYTGFTLEAPHFPISSWPLVWTEPASLGNAGVASILVGCPRHGSYRERMFSAPASHLNPIIDGSGISLVIHPRRPVPVIGARAGVP